MKKVEERLLNIVRSSYVNQIDMDYFKKHVKENPNLWGNYYLWSVESHNYQFSNYIIRCGFNLNNDNQVRREVKNSFEFFKRDYVKKIIEDGFVLDEQLMNEIKNYNSSLNIFDDELYNEVFLNERKKKLNKIISRKKGLSINNKYISAITV